MSSLRRVAATFRTPGEERARRPVQWDSARIEAMLTRQVPPKLYEYGRNYRALYVYRSDIFVPIKRDALDSSKETLASLVSESVGDRPPLSVVPLTGEDCVLLYPLHLHHPADGGGGRAQNFQLFSGLYERFHRLRPFGKLFQRHQAAAVPSALPGSLQPFPVLRLPADDPPGGFGVPAPLNKNDFSSIEMILTCILSSVRKGGTDSS